MERAMSKTATIGRKLRRACAAAALAIAAPRLAGAAPEGEQVVSGEATFTRDGSLTLITTGTPQTIVNYTGFDIGRGETVRIDQPDASSRILNNVLSVDPTRINGVLTSNGQVWIANPVGVFFGDQAIVDVGRLVAGAGVVDPADFLAGTDRWSDLTGRVEVNAGAQIRAADWLRLRAPSTPASSSPAPSTSASSPDASRWARARRSARPTRCCSWAPRWRTTETSRPRTGWSRSSRAARCGSRASTAA
jgi:filamentous hemagglutinin family protein